MSVFQYKTLPEKTFIFALQDGRCRVGYGSSVVFPQGKMTGNCKMYPIWDDDGKTIVYGRESVNFEVNKQFHVVIPFGDSIKGVPFSSMVLILDESNPYLKRMLNFGGSHEFMAMRNLNLRLNKQLTAKDVQLDQIIMKSNRFYQNVMGVVADGKISQRGAKQSTGVLESASPFGQNQNPTETTIE